MSAPRRRLARALAWLLGSAVAAAALTPCGARAADAPPPGFVARSAEPVRLRNDGSWAVAQYATDGTQLRRYTGFGEISDLARYDAQTLLVVDRQRQSVSALSAIDGTILWEVAAHRPRCVQTLAPDRLLVCEDEPAALREIDRSGRTWWQAGVPDAAGAVRLADGNTAVVEGKAPEWAVRVLDPRGQTQWSGTANLRQPRGLAGLPSGELVTSAFDRPLLVFFRPYTDEVRTIDFCCHAQSVAATSAGGLLSTLPERQAVQAWDPSGRPAWRFQTLYPPYDAEMGADGTVFVSLFEAPDLECLNATRAPDRDTRPLAPYWQWLIIGFASAVLLTIAVRKSEIRSILASALTAAPAPALPPPDPPLTIARRLEISGSVITAALLAAGAVLLQQRARLLTLWPYVLPVGAGGLVLAWLRSRTPAEAGDWAIRMRRLAPMAPPTQRMWLLWGIGVALLAMAIEGVIYGVGQWVAGAWIAGIVLLGGGALEAGKIHRPSPRAVLGCVLVAAALLVLRLYRLEAYPANLHHDSALATLQALRLLDGEAPGIFGDGWAEIPMPGYLWRALNRAVSGRSLAGVRFPSGIGSLLAIAATFFLARRLYGAAVATIAVAVLGMDQTFLHFSRIPSTYMDPVPFHVLALLGMVAGLESGRYGWFALAGFAAGYCALTYHAGRIIPALLALLAGLLLLAFPRALAARWRGLVLAAVMLLGVIAPQAALYAGRRANPYGRFDQLPWLQQGTVDVEALRQTVANGVPRVLGSLWWAIRDSSTQYGGETALFAPLAAFLAMAAIAALLRAGSVREIWVVVWGVTILVVGGVVTRDPPFWPRMLMARVPLAIAVAAALGSLLRAAALGAGRRGGLLATAAVAALLYCNGAHQLDSYRRYVFGIPTGGSQPTQLSQRVESIMGRDIQHWGREAMVYIVARVPIEHSCGNATIQYFAAEADARNARDITRYLPFRERRTVVCYVVPEMRDAISIIDSAHPGAARQDFQDNLGRRVFTRLVIQPPASDAPGR